MTLAKRVRDCRYAKGWGPDELASRASISRTALYQIECGKTETPRAATIRRIAQALDVPVDTLIRGEDPAPYDGPGPFAPRDRRGRRAASSLEALDILGRAAAAGDGPGRGDGRHHDLDRMFHELLDSP